MITRRLRHLIPTGLAAAAFVLSTSSTVAATPAPIPVNVINNNATPSAIGGFLTILDGQYSGYAAFAVPTGKRFIVQMVSFYRFGQNSFGSAVHGLVEATVGTRTVDYPTPAAIADIANYNGVAAPMTFEASAGTLSFLALRNASQGTEQVQVTFTGYLVDAP